MKKLMLVFFVILLIITVIPSNVKSQGNWYNFEEAELSLWVPDNWEVSREHVLLLLMPKPEIRLINFQLFHGAGIEKVVEEKIKEVNKNYPQLDCKEKNLVTINNLKGYEVDCVTKDSLIVYNLFLETPNNKIIQMFYIVSPEDFKIYANDIKKIKEKIRKSI